VYVCTGCCVTALEPSPKFQVHCVGVLVEVSLNLTVKGTAPDVGVAVKLATGAGILTVMKLYLVVVFDPPSFEAFRETL